MEKRIYPEPIESIASPEPFARRSFTDAREAVAALRKLYDRNTAFLRNSFHELAEGGETQRRFRAFYPEVGSRQRPIRRSTPVWPMGTCRPRATTRRR